MAYTSYTKCVKPADYTGPVNILAGASLAGLIGLFTLNVGIATVGAILAGIAFCRWWLYGRLVCLGGNRCAIGLALEVFPPEDKTGLDREDTDYSVNLLLAPTTLFEGLNEASQDVQGALLAKSTDPDFQTMMSNFPGLGFTGEPEPFSGLINPEGAAPGVDLWQPNTVYQPGSVIQAQTSDFQTTFQTCNDTGPSGTSAPAWANTIGDTTQDGIIGWTCTGLYSVITQAGLLNLGLVDPGSWSPSTNYNAGDLILVGNPPSQTQVVQSCTMTGTSGPTPPVWQTTFGSTTSDGPTVRWTCLGVGGRWAPTYLDSTSYAQHTTTYLVGDQIIDANGNLQQCSVAGNSGSTIPSWATSIGATTIDNQVTWTRTANLAWHATTQYPAGTQITDSNGAAQTCTIAGASGSTHPSWSTVNGETTMDTDSTSPATWTRVGESINAIGTIEVEFEGGGMYDLYQALLIALPLAVAGAAVSVGIIAAALPAAAAAAAAGPWGWLLALLILIGAAIAQALASAPAAATAGAGFLAGQADVASPAADDPNIGTIYPGIDVLVVTGRWIYDSAHSGWNELHPVLHCQKVARVPQADLAAGTPWASLPQFSAANVETTLNQNTVDRMGWCPLITEAGDPATTTSQQEPQNGWTIHPVVDGCTPKTPRDRLLP
ncbi:MAG: hypothetical protein WCB01_08405 [Candidatus Cybelea sp.]